MGRLGAMCNIREQFKFVPVLCGYKERSMMGVHRKVSDLRHSQKIQSERCYRTYTYIHIYIHTYIHTYLHT